MAQVNEEFKDHKQYLMVDFEGLEDAVEKSQIELIHITNMKKYCYFVYIFGWTILIL